MSTTNILDLNNRIDALEKISHNVEPIQQQIDELKAWTDPGTKDASGNPIILTDGAAFNAEGLAVTCNPKQNLHGYDHPWAGGAGKNKIIIDETYIKSTNSSGSWNNDVYTYRGIDFTLLKDSDNNILGVDANGLSSGDWASIILSEFTLQPNTYILSGISAGGSSTFRLSLSPSTGSDIVLFDGETSFTITSAETFILKATVRSPQVTANHFKFYPMVRLSTESDSSFAPSANECPITGLTECVVEVKDEDETTQHTATITFGQTVYGGSVDFKTGKVTVTHASIASYNGESINEPWLSSIDEYVSGTTPTTRAQVVYPLTTPTELTLTPAELELLKGYNYITTNGDNIELTYQPDTLKADILLTVSQLYGSKISIFDGILAGGDTGQVLTKTSDDNYDATWETLPATRSTTRKTTKEEK